MYFSKIGVRRVRAGLLCGCGAVVLFAGTPALAQAEQGEEADGASEVASDSDSAGIVVTGTRIRGVAPVGSPVIQMDSQAIENTGLATTGDVVKKIPQVTLMGTQEVGGGAAQQAGSRDFTFAKSANLRGLGTAATLSLFNGHRVVSHGPSADIFDPDVIPVVLLDRIEVIPNGGSAIYGSDAIAGVVNYIWRKPYDGGLSVARFGFADGVKQWQVAQSIGKTWSTGGILIGVERTHSDPLRAEDRPNLFTDNLAPYGGASSSSNANPGNVIYGGKFYPIPTGQDGTSLGTGAFAAGDPRRQNVWTGVEATPEQDRWSVAGTFEQELFPGIEAFAEGYYSRRDFVMDQWPVLATLNVPHVNPYSPCYTGPGNTHPAPTGPLAAACTGGTSLSVATSYLGILGPSTRKGYDMTWNAVGGLRVDLPYDWQGTVQAGVGHTDLFQSQRNTPNATALSQVLGNSAGKPASVDYLNLFCDGYGTDCNSEATLNHFRAYSNSGRFLQRTNVLANVNGPLLSLPGGEVKLALGGEILWDTVDDRHNCFNNSTANVTTIQCRTPNVSDRDIKALFGEIFVPIIGADNASPGFEELSVTAAIRRDEYSDLGTTWNPNFGAVFAPVPGVRFRGSYSTSFRAPSPNDLFGTANTLGYAIARNILPLQPGSATGPDMTALYRTGPSEGIGPEDSKSWSVGVDFTPDLFRGFRASVTYYNITYTGLMSTPGFDVGSNVASTATEFAGYRIYNPRYFAPDLVAGNPVEEVKGITYDTRTIEGYDQMVKDYIAGGNLLQFGGPDARVAENVVIFLDGRRRNAGAIKTEGLDFYADYEFDVAGGTAHVGGSGNYVFGFKSALLPGAAVVERVNTFAYPLKFRGRADFGWSNDNWNFNGFVNYINPYNITRTFLPAGSPDEYEQIDGLVTVDMSLSYTLKTESYLTNDIRLTLAVDNLFDTSPPLVVNQAQYSLLFDPSNASPFGRFVSFQITKKW